MQIEYTGFSERYDKDKYPALACSASPEWDWDQPGVIVVIPAYNEARFIGSVVLSARRYAQRVLVIDDGSTDDTARIAEEAGAGVVEMERNSGKGAALRLGVEVALQQDNVHAVILLDGDGQHDPRELTRVVQPILDQEAELVIGSRFLKVRSPIPWWRQIGQNGLTWLTNLASDVDLTDSQSGYRALSPQAAKLLLRARSNGFSVESETQFLVREYGIRTKEVPISCVYAEPPKRNPVVHGLQVVDGVLRLVAQMRPLLFFGVPSACLLLIGFILGFRVVQIYDRTQELAVGYAMLTVLLTVSGAIGLSSAVILHSIRALLLNFTRFQRGLGCNSHTAV